MNINHKREPLIYETHHMTNPNPKSLKQIAISMTLVLGVTTVAGISILGASEALALRSAVVAYVQTADAGQGPQYVTFSSWGDCIKYVKENAALGYVKSDCQKGTPPEEPPTEG
jgi:hypothetical protein